MKVCRVLQPGDIPVAKPGFAFFLNSEKRTERIIWNCRQFKTRLGFSNRTGYLVAETHFEPIRLSVLIVSVCSGPLVFSGDV